MRALCVGSAMIDIIVLVDTRNVERMTMHNATSSFLLLEQGSKIQAESISAHVGGGAVNAAVAMARLGLDAAALVKIGRDANGDKIIDRLAAEDVDDTAVFRTDELPTGQAVMVSSHDRNATIFIQRGTNALLRPADFEAVRLEERQLVYIANLSNRSADCFPVIVERAQSAGAFVTVNPGIRQISSRCERLISSLRRVNLLALNRNEASALVPAIAARANGGDRQCLAGTREDCELPRMMRLGLSFGGFDMAFADFVGGILRVTAARHVLITDGTGGAFVADASGVLFCPALIVEVMGTAGAGDAFIATAAALMAEGAPQETVLRAAAVNAASVVSRSDTQSGLLNRPELVARLQADAGRLPIQRWSWKN
jgi:ribokinase